MEIEGSLFLVGLCPGLSKYLGAQWEPHHLSGKAKRGSPKVYQSQFRLLRGTGDFKGQILVPMCNRHQDKARAPTTAGPCCFFRWDGPDSHQYLLQQRTWEGGQGPEEGEKERYKACPDAGHPPGQLYGKPWVLEEGKCLICRQAEHWAKECPNHDKSPKMACYEYHHLGHWAILCPWDPRASRSIAKPSLMMVQQD